jgi:hypothetical protein
VPGERIGQVIGVECAPFAAQAQLDATVHRLTTRLYAFIECIAVGIQLFEAKLEQQVELYVVAVNDMHAARRAAGKQVPAVVEIERNQVELPLVVIIERPVKALSEPQAAAEGSCAGRGIEKRYFGNFLAGIRRRRDQRAERHEPGFRAISETGGFVLHRFIQRMIKQGLLPWDWYHS